MKTLKNVAALVGLLGLSCQILCADTDFLNSHTGIVQIFVQDELGFSVPNAPVYILDSHKMLTIRETNGLGAISLDMQEGEYVFSSAITRPIADSIDRYTSHEARIQVVPKDTTSVVLTLQLADDAISNLSMSALKKIGVADEVAKYYNN